MNPIPKFTISIEIVLRQTLQVLQKQTLSSDHV